MLLFGKVTTSAGQRDVRDGLLRRKVGKTDIGVEKTGRRFAPDLVKVTITGSIIESPATKGAGAIYKEVTSDVVEFGNLNPRGRIRAIIARRKVAKEVREEARLFRNKEG